METYTVRCRRAPLLKDHIVKSVPDPSDRKHITYNLWIGMDLMSMIDGNMVDVIRKGRYTHILFLFVDDTLDFSPGGPVYDHITCFYY